MSELYCLSCNNGPDGIWFCKCEYKKLREENKRFRDALELISNQEKCLCVEIAEKVLRGDIGQLRNFQRGINGLD